MGSFNNFNFEERQFAVTNTATEPFLVLLNILKFPWGDSLRKSWIQPGIA